jgi:hypothetical protein
MITKMNSKEDIKEALISIFDELNGYLKTVDDATFKKTINGKWSIAQNTDHLTLSNFITNLSLNIPKVVLKQLYDTNNGTCQNYDEVVWRYQRSLSGGAKATFPFQPKISMVPIRFLVEKLWENSAKELLQSMDSWTEEELDTYLIPHPIIGKITVRELLFFTVYHIQHHLNTIQSIH